MLDESGPWSVRGQVPDDAAVHHDGVAAAGAKQYDAAAVGCADVPATPPRRTDEARIAVIGRQSRYTGAGRAASTSSAAARLADLRACGQDNGEPRT